MKYEAIRFLRGIAVCLAVTTTCVTHDGQAQESWQVGDDSLEARKLERYQQLVDASPEKSYAFQQLMSMVGKGSGYTKLVSEYEKKVERQPRNVNLRMVLGHIYAHGGRTQEAIASYKKALELKASALAWVSIAAAESENKNFDEAVAAYDAALKLGPSKEQKQEIWRAQAEIALYRRDLERARACFAELIRLEPNSLFVRRELAQLYTQNRLYDEARRVLEEASSLGSSADKEQIALDIAKLYEQEGNDAEALRQFNALSQKLPASHWMQRELTAHIIDIHRRKGSVAELVDVLEARWKSPTYVQHLELADLYEETSQADKALVHLNKAVAMSPKLPEARVSLVEHYRTRGMMDKALEARQALIRAVPDNPNYRLALYQDYVQQKQIDRALGVLDDMTKAFKSDFDTVQRIAEAYLELGHRQKALALYETWVNGHPKDIQGLEALGDMLHEAGQTQKAKAIWKRIEALPMDQATKLETLARIYDEHGYADDAEALYTKSLAANPKDCQTRALRADVLTRHNRIADATAAWEELALVCTTEAMRTTAVKKLVELYQPRGQVAKALQKYLGASEENPDDLERVRFVARFAEEAGKPELALPALEAYVGRHPDDPQGLKAWFETQKACFDWKGASQTLDKLAALSPADRRDALISSADVDLAQGNLDAASLHLEQALQINANDAETHEKHADVLMKMREYRQAAAHYDEAFQIDPRNYPVAFKLATAMSILGQDDQVSALYIQIVHESTDEMLVQRAAQRVIDIKAFHRDLDGLATSFLPLLRAPRQKELHLEILLKLAKAQAQPHIFDIQMHAPDKTYVARHALRQYAEQYVQVLSEGLLSGDTAIFSQALELSAWLPSASVIRILGQKLEHAATTEVERDMQLQAVEAMAHAQLRAAVPILQKCLESHRPRALRERALWALGLIASPAASQSLRDALDSDLDSFRALAVIGLGRQGVFLDAIQTKLRDPSPVVARTATWMLAFHRIQNAQSDVVRLLSSEVEHPHQLWALSRIDPDTAARLIFDSLWTSRPEGRQMAMQIMTSQPVDVDLTLLTQAEAQGSFMRTTASHYSSAFDIDRLLDSFAQQAVQDSASAGSWTIAHADAFIAAVTRVSHTQNDAVHRVMLQDLVSPQGALGLDAHRPEHRALMQRLSTAIAPQLALWANAPDAQLAGLALRAIALSDSESALSTVIHAAKNAPSVVTRLDAIDALALFSDTTARASLRELAADPTPLVRAAAVALLDPADAQDRASLDLASHDDYAVVSRTARQRLLTVSP